MLPAFSITSPLSHTLLPLSVVDVCTRTRVCVLSISFSSTNHPLPVECVEHFNGDQHRQCHGHRVSVLKDLTVNASKGRIIARALHVVGLRKKDRREQDKWVGWSGYVGSWSVHSETESRVSMVMCDDFVVGNGFHSSKLGQGNRYLYWNL